MSWNSDDMRADALRLFEAKAQAAEQAAMGIIDEPADLPDFDPLDENGNDVMTGQPVLSSWIGSQAWAAPADPVDGLMQGFQSAKAARGSQSLDVFLEKAKLPPAVHNLIIGFDEAEGDPVRLFQLGAEIGKAMRQAGAPEDHIADLVEALRQKPVMLAARDTGTMTDANPLRAPAPDHPNLERLGNTLQEFRNWADQFQVQDWVPVLGGMTLADFLMSETTPQLLQDLAYGMGKETLPIAGGIRVPDTQKTTYAALDAAPVVGAAKGVAKALPKIARKLVEGTLDGPAVGHAAAAGAMVAGLASDDAEASPLTKAAKNAAINATGKAAKEIKQKPSVHIPREVVDVDLSAAQVGALKKAYPAWKASDTNPRQLRLSVKHFVESHVLDTGTRPEDAIEMMDKALANDAVVLPTKREGVFKFESMAAFPSPISYTRTPKNGSPIVINKGDQVKAVAIVRQDMSGRLELYSAAYEKARK